MRAPTFDAAIAEIVARAVDARVAELRRPELVTQRSIERVCSMPGRDYLRHCRAGDWPSWADRRLRYSKTEDVLAWVMAHPLRHAANDCDAEAEAFSKARTRIVRVAR